MGHQGSAENKIKAIEYIDDQVVGTVAEALRAAGTDFRMLILPDHPTPVRVRTHTSDPGPYLLYDSTKAAEGSGTYSEKTGKQSGKIDVYKRQSILRTWLTRRTWRSSTILSLRCAPII